MPNDDLGQFPTPSSSTPGTSPQPIPEKESFTTPPAFEETPEIIPSAITPSDSTSFPNEQSEQNEPPAAPPVQETVATPVETPATIAPKGGSAFGSFIGILLLMIAGVAIAAAVFLFSQSQQLKQQIQEITQTLEKQKTTVTPTPTPTIIEFLTPTPESTLSATPVLTPPTSATKSGNTVLPLRNAPQALKVAINHQPNAQLILIKTDNATNPQTATTKYFFRENLTTKKYFYVLIAGLGEPEIVDRSIYVTPDNNIPSLNDMVLGNTLGIDLDEAIALANGLCISGLCQTASVRSQYIKSADTSIWQLSFAPQDITKDTLIIQINSQTKAILFKSPGFTSTE